MQSHLGSVDVHGWVQSSFELLRDWWVKGETSAECKSIMIALLRVTSGLDPFLLEDDVYLCLMSLIPY